MECKFSKKRNRDEGAVTCKADIEEIQKRERERELSISFFFFLDK